MKCEVPDVRKDSSSFGEGLVSQVPDKTTVCDTSEQLSHVKVSVLCSSPHHHGGRLHSAAPGSVRLHLVKGVPPANGCCYIKDAHFHLHIEYTHVHSRN